MVIRLGPGIEFDMIRRFLHEAAVAAGRGDPAIRVGPGDDCAVVAGEGIAITTDMVVEDVHFRRAWLDPAEIGYHAAAAALSDLAAMAARPIGVLASVALGPGDEDRVGVELMDGVAAAVDIEAGRLLGGDLTRSPGPLVVDIVGVGEALRPVLRSGAGPGDEVWVTGALGGAAAAVAAWLDGRDPPAAARAAFARPRPRTREARFLARRGVPTAMLDLSDGIAGDAGHLAAASGVRVVVRAHALPVAETAREVAGSEEAAVGLAATGGQDYELCFTASPGAVEDAIAEELRSRYGCVLTRVGDVEAVGPGEAPTARIVGRRGEPLDFQAFQHWRAR
jgi:thiamine-monophosphate kinase